MNKLMENLKKIHTTEMGITRVKNNLELETNNVVEWCKNKIKKSKNIVIKGKNWYVDIGDSIITINRHSCTIITAHKKL